MTSCIKAILHERETSNFPPRKLAQSSKKLHAPWPMCPTGTLVRHFSKRCGKQQAVTIPLQHNQCEVSLQMQCWLYSHALPCCWSAHQISCLNITITSHTQAVCHSSFSPRPPSIAAAIRSKADSLGLGLPPLLPFAVILTKDCLCPLSKSTARDS